MRVTKTLVYALVCLKHLAERMGEYAEVHEISAAHGIPEAYCQKVLFALAKQGLVASVKGRGFLLELPLENISLKKITQALGNDEEEKQWLRQNGNGTILDRIEKQFSSIMVSALVL